MPPPRRRQSDRLSAWVLRAVGTALVAAVTFAASFLMTQREINARSAERLQGIDEFRGEQTHARDRELDDIKDRLGRLEDRCK